jgi:hypothetical protein
MFCDAVLVRYDPYQTHYPHVNARLAMARGVLQTVHRLFTRHQSLIHPAVPDRSS